METEVDNIPSLRIYEKLGFLRVKRLYRYYLNGNTAFRLLLYLKPGIPLKPTYPPEPPPMDAAEAEAYAKSTATGFEPIAEDQIVRQTAQMQIVDVHGETHQIMRRSGG